MRYFLIALAMQLCMTASQARDYETTQGRALVDGQPVYGFTMPLNGLVWDVGLIGSEPIVMTVDETGVPGQEIGSYFQFHTSTPGTIYVTVTLSGSDSGSSPPIVDAALATWYDRWDVPEDQFSLAEEHPFRTFGIRLDSNGEYSRTYSTQLRFFGKLAPEVTEARWTVVMSPVPEPMTAALVTLGLVGVLTAARSKRTEPR